MKALLSVFDKTDLEVIGRALETAGFELVSTGNTHRSLEEAGLEARQVSDLTGFPEMLGGRVKTLHPGIHGGILALRDNPGHVRELNENGIGLIDVVVSNLYPFVDAVSRPDATLQDALENIDIGGPTLIRASAKNFPHVLIVVDPFDYGWLAERLAEGPGAVSPVSIEERRALAQKAFQHVAAYDTAITRYLNEGDPLSGTEITFGYRRVSELRYGENPHQSGALYGDPLEPGGIAGASQLHGRPLSFNNILDADAAWRAVKDFEDTAVAVIKHSNPCGLAVHPDQPTAYRRAFEGDTVSAYGGIVSFNRPVQTGSARAMRGVFYEVVVAPGYDREALEVLTKRKNLRVLEVRPTRGGSGALDVRLVSGGALVQTTDVLDEDPAAWRIVTERHPTDREMADLAFAWKVAKHVKSNAIVVAKDLALLGMGAGQPNRVNSVRLSLGAAGAGSEGSVLASDALMPFADNVETAGEAGVAAVVQPGGSIRDDEVIAEADRRGMTMVFTGVRHFRH